MLIADKKIFDGAAASHMLDWNSSKVKLKKRSTFAVETAAATHGVDRATWARAIIVEMHYGRLGREWPDLIKKLPMGLATDCKSATA